MPDKQSTQLTKELLASTLKEQWEAFARKEVGIERELLASLSAVIKTPQIIVITGLRRVGKSTLMAQAAKKYLGNDFYFVNFEDERLLNFHVSDFDLLFETLVSLFGEKRTFLFDEIQNVPQWERFVRRLHDQGYKFIVTGSNASLLSQELGTRLTGRSIRLELYPFSFREFLTFKQAPIPKGRVLTTREKGLLLKRADEYLLSGGIPDALKYPELDIHKTLYDDVLYRDIATRYKIDNVKELKELAFYLISNSASLVSYNKLKELLKLGSVNTVKRYIGYLENSWLFFIVNKYAYSVKEQQIAAKKIYSIDTGLAQSTGFSFSDNKGKLMENAVYLKLRVNQYDPYYYKTQGGYEVDFFLPKTAECIQVVQTLDDEVVMTREMRAFSEISTEQKKIKTFTLITEREKRTIKNGDHLIHIVPLYEWLLRTKK